MKVLLHVCCAPCLGGPLEILRGEGAEVAGFFYNPNIHPLLEFRRRLLALKVFNDALRLPFIWDEEYGLETFLDAVGKRRHAPERCRECYRLRLGRVAEQTRAAGCAAFTSTLLGSAHQNHEAIRQAGEEAARGNGVEFLYRDFRLLAEKSHEQARRRHLYLQNYCGCVFSEFERYRDTTRHLYRAAGETNAREEEN